jgi:DDE superfamily endonuclease
MLLTPIPWAQRIWALPVMTALSPSERYYQQRGRTPQTLLERSVQMLKVLRRWCPQRVLVVVGDSAYAALDFLSAVQQLHLTFVTRLRLDAALYEPAPPYSGKGRPRKKGQRLPRLAQLLQDAHTVWTTVSLSWYDGQVRDMQITSACAVWFHFGKPALPIRWVLVRDPQRAYDPLALLSTDPTVDPLSIVTWYVQRWQVEVTFEETRRHLGLETQPQWSDKAIARTTPLLLGLFSFVTLIAHTCFTAQPSTPPLSPMPLLWCVTICGLPIRLFEHLRKNPACSKSPNRFLTHLFRPYVTLPDVQSRAQRKDSILSSLIFWYLLQGGSFS